MTAAAPTETATRRSDGSYEELSFAAAITALRERWLKRPVRVAITDPIRGMDAELIGVLQGVQVVTTANIMRGRLTGNEADESAVEWSDGLGDAVLDLGAGNALVLPPGAFLRARWIAHGSGYRSLVFEIGDRDVSVSDLVT